MVDEGLHEIQLNGKQLVFLFMASTVVAVVIFLCGVMVGRGVPAQRASGPTEVAIDAVADPTAVTTQLPATASTVSSSSSNTPVAPQEKVTYPDRLEDSVPPEETLKEPVVARPAIAKPSTPAPVKIVKAVPPVAPVKPAQSKPAPGKAPVAAASQPSSEPAGNGFAVQVAAVNDRRDAETIAQRLAGKGYPSFVATPGSGTPHMFRVRVGKYKNRREAELIASRLQKEEQFKPWVTR